MSKVYTGSVFNVPELSDEGRIKLGAELAEIERKLNWRRKRLAYWTLRKEQAEVMVDLPLDMREGAVHFYTQSLKLVRSGEKLRATILAELYAQTEHRDPYYRSH